MWNVESTFIVPIVVSVNGLLAKSFDQHLKKHSLGCWIKGRIQKAVVLETARIVRTFLTLSAGDLPRPRSKGEYVYVIAQLMFGLMLFATVLGHVANIVTSVSTARKEFQEGVEGTALVRLQSICTPLCALAPRRPLPPCVSRAGKAYQLIYSRCAIRHAPRSPAGDHCASITITTTSTMSLKSHSDREMLFATTELM
ncbi:jg12800 [Pararge aegeria aegeria]|uniref:Jg12800 protein n=1 Tax=Pararge aegeria aegeria TaxID=348720 RepID=A0A8S4RJH0_9NEOP|nr:jg12800 [Pararge aegeria aegeria]